MIQKLKISNIIRKLLLKNNIYKFKFKKFFFFPFLINLEFKNMRFMPQSGDLVVLKFYYKHTGFKLSFFKYSIWFGLCMARSLKGNNSSFIIRNSYKRSAFEFKFFLYSFLLKSFKIFFNNRKFYNKSRIFFLRERTVLLNNKIL